MKGGSLILNSF